MTSTMLNDNNDLLQQARSSEWLPPFWAVIPITVLFLILSQLGAVPIVMLNLISRLATLTDPTIVIEGDMEALMQLAWPQTPLGHTLILISGFAGIYGLLWLWVKFIEKRPFKSLGLGGRNILFKFGRGLGVGLFMITLAVVIGRLFGFYRLEVSPVLSMGTIGGVLLVLLGWLVQGPAEELIFRGWVLPVISARYKLWAGIGLSALMFAIIHTRNPGVSLLATLNLLLFGLFAALYALSEESIWGVSGIHIVWNWLQGNIFGLAVSGLPASDASLFITQEIGPDIWTGGAFGPEGGLIVTLILAIAIGGVFLLNRGDH